MQSALDFMLFAHACLVEASTCMDRIGHCELVTTYKTTCSSSQIRLLPIIYGVKLASHIKKLIAVPPWRPDDIRHRKQERRNAKTLIYLVISRDETDTT